MDLWNSLPPVIQDQGPTVLFLGFILWAGAKRHWVFGWVYEEKAAHAAKMEELLDRNLAITQRVTTVAESVVPK
jgi:cell division protein FtsB